MGESAWMAPVLEVHLLDAPRDCAISPRGPVRVEFVRFLRPERKFSGIRALCRQIAADIAAARLD
jgi:FAD synthase